MKHRWFTGFPLVLMVLATNGQGVEELANEIWDRQDKIESLRLTSGLQSGSDSISYYETVWKRQQADMRLYRFSPLRPAEGALPSALIRNEQGTWQIWADRVVRTRHLDAAPFDPGLELPRFDPAIASLRGATNVGGVACIIIEVNHPAANKADSLIRQYLIRESDLQVYSQITREGDFFATTTLKSLEINPEIPDSEFAIPDHLPVFIVENSGQFRKLKQKAMAEFMRQFNGPSGGDNKAVSFLMRGIATPMIAAVLLLFLIAAGFFLRRIYRHGTLGSRAPRS